MLCSQKGVHLVCRDGDPETIQILRWEGLRILRGDTGDYAPGPP